VVPGRHQRPSIEPAGRSEHPRPVARSAILTIRRAGHKGRSDDSGSPRSGPVHRVEAPLQPTHRWRAAPRRAQVSRPGPGSSSATSPADESTGWPGDEPRPAITGHPSPSPPPTRQVGREAGPELGPQSAARAGVPAREPTRTHPIRTPAQGRTVAPFQRPPNRAPPHRILERYEGTTPVQADGGER
jgi:hypothetical protein